MAATSKRSSKKALSSVEPSVAPAYAAALKAYGNGEYTTALTCLDLDTEAADRVRNAILRCRIARIQEDADAWYEHASFAFAHAEKAVDRYTAQAFLAVAARQLGREAEARRIFDRIAVDIETPRGELVDAAYLFAVECWQERDLDRAEAIAKSFIASEYRDTRFVELLGWIAIRRERYAEAGKHFVAALRAAKEAADTRLIANCLHGVAIVACDTVDLKLCRVAIREYEKIVWPRDLWYIHFSTLVSLRLCRLLEGDSIGAYFDVRRAVEIAGSPTYAVIGEVLSASASHRLGDRRSYELLVARAWSMIESINWAQASSEERMALSEFALTAAEIRPAEARKALIRLRSITPKLKNTALDRDRRSEAYEAWAQARVLEISGRRVEAIEGYKKAYELWTGLGYLLRAAFVGFDLYRLTSDARWHVPYEQVLSKAPDADFSDLAVTSRALPRLTPAQTRVLVALLDGRSAKDGAQIVGCAVYTFTNHTRKVFEAFEVRSRDQLKERCANLGVSASSLRSAGYG